MQKETWRFGSAKAVYRMTPDGMVQIDVTGPISEGVMVAIRNECGRALGRPGVQAMTVNFQRAIVLMNHTAEPMANLSLASRRAAIPVAYVCTAVDEPFFVAHAWRQAQLGLTRAAFTDADAAASWARARASGSSVLGGL